MADDLPPGTSWPDHPRPEARAALNDARAAGWRFRKAGTSGHAFGQIRCPHPDDATCCKVIVFSTSRSADGSATAKHIRQKLRRCPHDTPDPIDDDELRHLDDVEIARRADRLTEAIGSLRRRAGAEAERDAALEADDEVAFDAADARMVGQDVAGTAAFRQLGRPTSPWPPEVAVGELVAEVRRMIGALGDEDERNRLAAALDAPSH